MDIESCFIDAMRGAGVNVDITGGHPIADGRMHRAHAIGKSNKRNNHVWYVLHTDGIPAGAFGDMQTGISSTWCAKSDNELTDEDRRSMAYAARTASEARERHRRECAAIAADVATKVVSWSHMASKHHPYLMRKGLDPTGRAYIVHETIKYSLPDDTQKFRTLRRGTLFIPAYVGGGKLVGGQQINADGSKYFIKGTPKTGSYHPIGRAPSELVIICEGWATAARIHWLTGHPTVAAFDSGNLKPVAVAMRRQYPGIRIIIAADNDRFGKRQDGTPFNPGVHYAKQAALACGGEVIVPRFPGDDGSDFDDLAQISGIEEAQNQIMRLTRKV